MQATIFHVDPTRVLGLFAWAQAGVSRKTHQFWQGIHLKLLHQPRPAVLHRATADAEF